MSSNSVSTNPSISLLFSAPQGLRPGTSMFAGTFKVVPIGFDGIKNQGATALGALLDGSGSMKEDFIAQACDALIRLIEELPEAMRFFLVGFGNAGELLIPVDFATSANKKKWITAVRKFERHVNSDQGEGTYMGSGFKVLIAEIKKQLKGVNVTVVAYTDGVINDELEVDSQMTKLIALRQEGFSIKGYLRGIGDRWDASTLDAVSKAFMGDTELVGGRDYDIGKDLSLILSDAASQVIGNVRIDYWAPAQNTLEELSQQNPVQVPLIDSVVKDPADPKGLTKYLPIGSLSAEPVNYFFSIKLTPHPVGDQPVTAAKIGLRYTLNGTEIVVPPTKLLAVWTSDEAVYGDVPEATRRALAEKKTNRLIEDADQLVNAGRADEAAQHYADALMLAEVGGNTELADRLRKVVNVDKATGRVSIGDASAEATRRVRSASRRTGRVVAEENV